MDQNLKSTTQLQKKNAFVGLTNNFSINTFFFGKKTKMK